MLLTVNLVGESNLYFKTSDPQGSDSKPGSILPDSVHKQAASVPTKLYSTINSLPDPTSL